MVCKKCNGTGEVGRYENGAPYGAGYWPMWVPDVCSDCVEKGLCPRCGKEMKETNDTGFYRCPYCGWDETNGETVKEVS